MGEDESQDIPQQGDNRKRHNARQRDYFRHRYATDPAFRARNLERQKFRYLRNGGKGYTRRKPDLAANQIERTGFTFCVLCQKQFNVADLTVDHIIPRSKGGTDATKNLTLLCTPCNTRKQARTQEEAEARTVAALGPIQGVLQ